MADNCLANETILVSTTRRFALSIVGPTLSGRDDHRRWSLRPARVSHQVRASDAMAESRRREKNRKRFRRMNASGKEIRAAVAEEGVRDRGRIGVRNEPRYGLTRFGRIGTRATTGSSISRKLTGFDRLAGRAVHPPCTGEPLHL